MVAIQGNRATMMLKQLKCKSHLVSHVVSNTAEPVEHSRGSILPNLSGFLSCVVGAAESVRAEVHRTVGKGTDRSSS